MEMPAVAHASSQLLSSSPLSSSSLGFRSLQFLRFKHDIEPLECKTSRRFSPRTSADAGGERVVYLLDYGAGNVRSVRNAIRFLGFDIKDVQTPEDILNARRLIFPGVGSFASAMDVLNRRGFAEALCSYIEQDRPIFMNLSWTSVAL